MRAAADIKGFPECEGIFRVGVLPVSASYGLCVCSLRPQSPGCSRLNHSSFPKSAPTPKHPILTNDCSVFAFCISESPQPHPFLILLSRPLCPINLQFPSILSHQYLSPLMHCTPFLLPRYELVLSILHPGSVYPERPSVLWRSCTFPSLWVFGPFPLSRLILFPVSSTTVRLFIRRMLLLWGTLSDHQPELSWRSSCIFLIRVHTKCFVLIPIHYLVTHMSRPGLCNIVAITTHSRYQVLEKWLGWIEMCCEV